MLEQVPRILAQFRPTQDGDIVDRYLVYYTPTILLACTALISTKQYMGKRSTYAQEYVQ